MSFTAKFSALCLSILLMVTSRSVHAQAVDQDETQPSVPEHNTEVPPQGKRNIGMLVGGIVATGTGGLALFVGGISLAAANASSTQVCENESCRPATESERETMRSLGTVGLVTGIVLVSVGIPLIVIGARRRPVVSAARTGELQLMAAAGGGSLRWTF